MLESIVMGDRSVAYGKKVHTLFVDNLPSNLSNVGLKQIFKGVGDIADVVVSKKIRSSKLGRFGFVRFWDVGVANRAIEKTNGRSIEGRRILVKWARFERKEKIINNLDEKRSKLQEVKGVSMSDRSKRSFADVLKSKAGGLSSSTEEVGCSRSKIVGPDVGSEVMDDGGLVLDWFHNMKSSDCLEAKFKFLIENRVVEVHLVDLGPAEKFGGKGEVVVKGVGVKDVVGDISGDCSKGNSKLLSDSDCGECLAKGDVGEDDPVVIAMLGEKTNSHESQFVNSNWVGKLDLWETDGSWESDNDIVGNMDGQRLSYTLMGNREKVGQIKDSCASGLVLEKLSGGPVQEGPKDSLRLSECRPPMGEVKGHESLIVGPVEEISSNKGVIRSPKEKGSCDDNFFSSPSCNSLINEVEAQKDKGCYNSSCLDNFIRKKELFQETQENCQTIKERRCLEHEESIMHEEYLEILNQKEEISSERVVTTRKSTRKRVPRVFHVGPRVVVI